MYLRRVLAESALFQAAQAGDGDASSDADLRNSDNTSAPAPTRVAPVDRARHIKSILLVIGLVAGGTAAHYTWTSYASTYAITQEGMDTQAAYWVKVFAQINALSNLPL